MSLASIHAALIIGVIIQISFISSTTAAISCLNDAGQAVDWWLISSVPGQDGHWISTSAVQKPTWIPYDINHCSASLKNTLEQRKAEGVGMLTYNDDGAGDDMAHANGAVLWQAATDGGSPRVMDDTALWITSSCPSFGTIAHEYAFGHCMTLQQHAQCVSFNPQTASAAQSWRRYADDAVTAIGDGLRPTLLQAVGQHLWFRSVRIIRRWCEAVNNDFLVDGDYTYIARLCRQQANPGAQAPMFTDGYVLQTTLTSLAGTAFQVFSKKQGTMAGLWDDIVAPIMDTLSGAARVWKVSTWKHGSSKLLPAACCQGVAVTFETDNKAVSLRDSCRAQCRPLRFYYAYAQVIARMNQGDDTICDGYHDTVGGRKALYKVIAAMAGEKVAPPDLDTWKGLFGVACTDVAALDMNGVNTLRALARNVLSNAITCPSTILAVQHWRLTTAAITGLPADLNKWAVTCDHSKLGWNNNDVVCAGDLNRQGGKYSPGGNVFRGGGAICWTSANLRASLDAVTKTFTCNGNQISIGGGGYTLYHELENATNNNSTSSSSSSIISPTRSLSSSLSSSSAIKSRSRSLLQTTSDSSTTTTTTSTTSVTASRNRAITQPQQSNVCDARCNDLTSGNNIYCCPCCNEWGAEHDDSF